MMPLKKVEGAYLAGIIDGEGTMTLARQRRNETPVPTVSIANNNLEPLKRVKCWLGGGSIVHKKKRKAHHSESYAWIIRHDKALRLLKDVQPYLIVKRPQAGLIIRKYKSVTHRAGKYTPELFKKRCVLWQKSEN